MALKPTGSAKKGLRKKKEGGNAPYRSSTTKKKNEEGGGKTTEFRLKSPWKEKKLGHQENDMGGKSGKGNTMATKKTQEGELSDQHFDYFISWEKKP